MRRLRAGVRSAEGPGARATRSVSGGAPRRGARAIDCHRAVTSGAVEFVKLELRHLAEVSVVAQSLDNQWMPRCDARPDAGGGVEACHDVTAQREHAVGAQVPSAPLRRHRAARRQPGLRLRRTRWCSANYLEPGPHSRSVQVPTSRQTSSRMPYLFERGDADRRSPGFTTNRRGFAALGGRFVARSGARCVRISWDDAADASALSNELRCPLPRAARSLPSTTTPACTPSTSASPRRRRSPSSSGLLAMAAEYLAKPPESDRYITHNDLYRRVHHRRRLQHGMTASIDQRETVRGRDGTDFSNRSYDVEPARSALGRYALTPFDSLPAHGAPGVEERLGQEAGGSRSTIGSACYRGGPSSPPDPGSTSTPSPAWTWPTCRRCGRRMSGASTWTASGACSPGSAELRGGGRWGPRWCTSASPRWRKTHDDASTRARASRSRGRPVVELDIDIAGGVGLHPVGEESGLSRTKGAPSREHSDGQARVVVTLNIRDAAERAAISSDLATNVDSCAGRSGTLRSELQELPGLPARASKGSRRCRRSTTRDRRATLNLPEGE